MSIGHMSTHTLLSVLIFSSFLFAQNALSQTLPVLKTSRDPGSAYTLPAGTLLRVKMDNGITSRSANVNDTFTATVSAPVTVRTVEVVPVGAVIEGRVLNVKPAARGGAGGKINVTFETLKLPGGAVRKIAGEMTAFDSETSASDIVRSAVEGDGASSESVAFIAGGAGAGALVGGLAKGGSGAAPGGALGAGAGFLASYFRKGDEAIIKTNAEFGVVLKQSVTLPANDY
jgi:hypothetical protein